MQGLGGAGFTLGHSHLSLAQPTGFPGILHRGHGGRSRARIGQLPPDKRASTGFAITCTNISLGRRPRSSKRPIPLRVKNAID